MLFRCKCGEEFQTSFDEFKHMNKRQCNECGSIKQTKSRRNSYSKIKDFIEGKEGNGCKLLSQKYKNNSTKMLFKCKCGNEFRTTFGKFKDQNKKQCNDCGMKSRKAKLRKTHDEFVEELYNLVGDDITVLDIYTDSQVNIEVQCNICGNVWSPRPNDMLQGTGCPQCTGSKGERKIFKWLTKNNIHFMPEYKFKDCKNKLPLPFDFYLLEYNTLIEYDGEGHYEPFRFSKDKQKMLNKFKQQQKHDNIKNTYCIKNNIKLVRIPYWDFNNIEQILDEVLFENDSAYFIA